MLFFYYLKQYFGKSHIYLMISGIFLIFTVFSRLLFSYLMSDPNSYTSFFVRNYEYLILLVPVSSIIFSVLMILIALNKRILVAPLKEALILFSVINIIISIFGEIYLFNLWAEWVISNQIKIFYQIYTLKIAIYPLLMSSYFFIWYIQNRKSKRKIVLNQIQE
ncbi:MAG: hypothetical protein HeimC3_37450 [Candidatus Heimdallarchaeota archaeon LC_3]|nr:MAG: hypothetical protein HeimC3_37450 [Candidatus Heimdallarchaeota archaeon LC_3]